MTLGPWCLAIGFLAFAIAHGSLQAFYPTHLQGGLGMEMTMANTKTGLMTFGMIAGAFLMTAILSRAKNLYRLLVQVTVITGISFSMAFSLNAEWQVVPFALLMGIVLQMIPPVVFAVGPNAARS